MMLHLVVCALLMVSASSLAATPAKKKAKAPPPPSVALIALDGLASTADKNAVDTELRALLPATGFVVQKRDKTDATLAAVKKLGLVCDSGDVDCLIRVGALSGVTMVLKGALSPDGDGFGLDLVAADVNALRERARVHVFVPASTSERRSALDSALTGVLRPEAWRGQLRVAVAQRGASIVVDGVPRGFSPLSTPLELTPGPHTVHVVLEGFRTQKESVDVVYQDEVAVDVTLVPGVSEEAPLFSTAPKVIAPPAPLTTSAPRKHPLRVVLYDIEAAGVPPRVATVLQTLLVAELRKREQVSVLDSGELRALVGEGESTTGDVRACSAEQCFAEVAEALGADVVVVAQLTQLEGQVLFGLRRIDQEKQEVTGSFLERVPADDTAALLPLVGKSIDATFVDVPLRAGQVAGVDARAARIMNPPPLPPLLSGSLYVGAGVAAVGAAAGGVVAVVNGINYERLLASPEATATSTANAELQDNAAAFSTGQTIGLVAAGAAIVLATAAVITGWSTDWNGDGAAVEGETP